MWQHDDKTLKNKAVAKGCKAAFFGGIAAPVGAVLSVALAPLCGLQFLAQVRCDVLAKKYDKKLQELKEEYREHRSSEELGPEASQQQERNAPNMQEDKNNVPLSMKAPSDFNNQPASCVAEAICQEDQEILEKPAIEFISTV